MKNNNYIGNIVFLLSIVFILSSANRSEAEGFSKFLLGFSSSYFNYYPLENQYGLNLSGDKFLIGIDIGLASKGLIFDFSYLYKVYPNEKYTFSGYNLIEQFDSYVFSLSYVFTISEDKFYIGPLIVISIDNSLLRLYNDFNFSSFLTQSNVKEIISKVVSLGGGIGIVLFRNIMLNLGYFYSFPSTYSYQSVNMPDSFVFQPTGLRVFLNINI